MEIGKILWFDWKMRVGFITPDGPDAQPGVNDVKFDLRACSRSVVIRRGFKVKFERRLNPGNGKWVTSDVRPAAGWKDYADTNKSENHGSDMNTTA